MLTIALHFVEKSEDVKAPIKHFRGWKEAYRYIRQNNLNSKYTQVISNLAISQKEPEQILTASKDNGYWIIDMYLKD